MANHDPVSLPAGSFDSAKLARGLAGIHEVDAVKAGEMVAKAIKTAAVGPSTDRSAKRKVEAPASGAETAEAAAETGGGADAKKGTRKTA